MLKSLIKVTHNYIALECIKRGLPLDFFELQTAPVHNCFRASYGGFHVSSDDVGTG